MWRQLSEKDVLQTDQNNAFKAVKQLVTTAPVLRYYDIAEEVNNSE